MTTDLIIPPDGLPQLAPRMQRHVDRTLAADRKGGEALWEKALAVADARAEAEPGEWGGYLEATGQHERAARRLIAIAERGRSEARFRDAIIAGWLTFSVGAIAAQADDDLLTTLLDQPTPPTRQVVEQLTARPDTSVRSPELPTRPAGAPTEAAYEEAAAAWAARGYTLSCGARTDGHVGCPPYWIVNQKGTPSRHSTWEALVAAFAGLGTAPAFRSTLAALSPESLTARGIALDVDRALIPPDWDAWRTRALALPGGRLTLSNVAGVELWVSGVKAQVAYLGTGAQRAWARITGAIVRHEARFAPDAPPARPESLAELPALDHGQDEDELLADIAAWADEEVASAHVLDALRERWRAAVGQEYDDPARADLIHIADGSEPHYRLFAPRAYGFVVARDLAALEAAVRWAETFRAGERNLPPAYAAELGQFAAVPPRLILLALRADRRGYELALKRVEGRSEAWEYLLLAAGGHTLTITSWRDLERTIDRLEAGEDVEATAPAEEAAPPDLRASFAHAAAVPARVAGDSAQLAALYGQAERVIVPALARMPDAVIRALARALNPEDIAGEVDMRIVHEDLWESLTMAMAEWSASDLCWMLGDPADATRAAA